VITKWTLPYKAVRVSVGSTYTHLTQPTGVAADWAGVDFIIHLSLHAPVGLAGRFDSAKPEGKSKRLDAGGV
jgi:hypothetical protein